MKKKFLLFLLAISLIMCRNKYSNQSNQDDVFAQIKYIRAKYILLHKEKNLNLSENTIYLLEGQKYFGEIVIEYNAKGEPIRFFRSGSEGYVLYERENIYGETLPFEEEMYLYHISLDKNEHYIIDNNDTIRDFSFVKGEKKIKTSSNLKGRFIVYEYE
ncbi:hypothetical protein J4N46_10310 [Capnocytophaga sp. Marseille-Q4570]|uniref:Lipoprotein n=1 Tax=Capnocytophaga bilenii TaxID=2819369 RepID=A0ABS3PZN2_9FLAO|nr:hypothetical protein [Capnocytophaga bilenii]MBO1884790.1 hypothetical protein [Capnocytophaga bilenii]